MALAAPTVASAQVPSISKETPNNVVAAQYAKLCAGCHGSNLEGAEGPSLLAETFKQGSDDQSISLSIRLGSPERGMPAWGATLSEADIRSLVIYIREQRAGAHGVWPPQLRGGEAIPNGVLRSEQHAFRVETVVDTGLDVAWSMTFLPGDRLLVTQKNSFVLREIQHGRLLPEAIKVSLDTAAATDSLLAVASHPDYAHNGWIYLSYSEAAKERATDGGTPQSWLVLARGRLRENVWTDASTLLRLPTFSLTGRVAFDGHGHVFLTAGSTGIGLDGRLRNDAQDLAHPSGKIFRVNDDGTIPEDNPFVDDSEAIPSIWSFGHRVPQGLAFDRHSASLWSTEHGPRGGDELNYIRRGANYGWPMITYGMNYDGTPISDKTAQDRMEQPVVDWTPSIGVSNITFYEGKAFPRWRHNLFVTSLRGRTLYRFVIDEERVSHREVILENIGRLRDIAVSPEGYLYLLIQTSITPAVQGRIVRLVPSR